MHVPSCLRGRTSMRKFVLAAGAACALTGFAFAGVAIAQGANNNPLNDSSYTCDFLPTEAYKAGTVYSTERRSPISGLEKRQFINGDFEQPYNTDKALNVAGATTSV